MSEQVILNIAGVNKRFGGLQALTDVGIKILKGQIYGLIGPNGAGKTTFFNLITGFDRPSSAGQGAHWSFDGRTLDRTSASRVARSGRSAPSSSPRR